MGTPRVPQKRVGMRRINCGILCKISSMLSLLRVIPVYGLCNARHFDLLHKNQNNTDVLKLIDSDSQNKILI